MPLRMYIPGNYADVREGGHPQGAPPQLQQFRAGGWKLQQVFSIHRTKFGSACSPEFACTSPPHSPTTDRDGVGAPLVGALVSSRHPLLRWKAGRPQGTPLRLYIHRQLCGCRNRRAPTRGAPTIATISRRWIQFGRNVPISPGKTDAAHSPNSPVPLLPIRPRPILPS